MEYAVIATGGKQYVAEPGKRLVVESLPGEPGDQLVFDHVLLHANGAAVTLGRPRIDGLTVEATIVEQGLADKIRVFKYKSKSRYRRTQGHRQRRTVVEVRTIGGKKTAAKADNASAKKEKESKPSTKEQGT